MLTILEMLPLAAVVLIVCWIGLRLPAERLSAVRTFPESRVAPIAAAIITMVVVWYVWGSTLNQISIVHDEASYLLQAETFALGRWAMPSPPMPEFFEQFHVFVTPAFASKYPPGHGVLLVPGIWLGMPGLVPLLLAGLTAALLVILVRRVTNGWVAMLTFMLWLPLQSNLWYRPSYLSENTTSVLWLLGWWALVEWGENGRERWLALIAACTAWMAITRPLTAVAFALPVAAVVLWRVARQRKWRQVVRPALLAVAILTVIPVWSAKTTGSWRETPYGLYSKMYFPFDVMGFGFDTTSPARSLPPDMQAFVMAYGPVHAAHQVDRLPRIFYDRWNIMFEDAFNGLRMAFAAFAIIGLIALTTPGWFAVIGSLTLTLCYLVFAHPADWDVYYLEIVAIFPFLSACGIWAVWLSLGKAKRGESRAQLLHSVPSHAAYAAALLVLLLIVPARADVVRVRHEELDHRSYQVAFARRIAALPDARSIVFIKYMPRHDLNSSFIANQADLPNARTWLVYDRGADDARLAALAPNRVPYLYDEATRTLSRIHP